MSRKEIYRTIVSSFALMSVTLLLSGATVFAQPFGFGKFGALVPFGSATAISIATSGNVNLSLNPSSSGTLGTGTNTVTVTSTDAVGYKLYLRALSSTNLTSGGNTIPASGNASPASLSINTWGYNTDASSNFTGVTSTDALIKSALGPYETGDATTFTYGVYLDNTKPPGNYTTTIIYTVLPQSY